MATINTSGKLDGTTVNSNLTITVHSRTATAVTFYYSIVTYLNPTGSTDAGYEIYTGTIGISGYNISASSDTVTLKELSEGWSGSTQHTKTGYITLNTTSYADLAAVVTYTVRSSKDSSNSNTGSATISTGSGAVIPTAPTSFSVKAYGSGSSSYFYIGYNSDSYITLSASGGSNVSYYQYQVSVNGGSYVACNATYYPTSNGKDITYKFRVYSVSSTGNTSSYVYSGTITAVYRASSAPTSITAVSNNSKADDKFYIGFNADTVVNLSASGGTNVSSYQYQVRKNGGTWENCSAPYTPLGLSAGNTLQFRVCVVGLSGSNSGYIESSVLTVLYYTPDAPFSITFDEEMYLPHKGTISLSWAKPVQTVTGYKLQYSINGGEWISLADETDVAVSYTNIPLKFKDEITFRIAAYNASGVSDYAISPVLSAVGGLYRKGNGEYKPFDCYIKMNGEYKRCTAYIKVGEEYKVSI